MSFPSRAGTWERDMERKPARTIAKIVGLIVGFLLLLGAAVWGLGVAFSWWKGQGDAHQQNNSAQNWIAAQRVFRQEYNDVEAFKVKIAAAGKSLAEFEQAHPGLGNGTPYDPLAQQDQNLRTTVSGLQQQCQNAVAGYNTDARSYLTQDWRDVDLPVHLDPAVCG